jgi:hypothetical protein
MFARFIYYVQMGGNIRPTLDDNLNTCVLQSSGLAREQYQKYPHRAVAT